MDIQHAQPNTHWFLFLERCDFLNHSHVNIFQAGEEEEKKNRKKRICNEKCIISHLHICCNIFNRLNTRLHEMQKRKNPFRDSSQWEKWRRFVLKLEYFQFPVSKRAKHSIYRHQDEVISVFLVAFMILLLIFFFFGSREWEYDGSHLKSC